MTSADKHIQLDVPAGLFKDATRVSITPRAAEQAKAQSGLLFQFDLQAQDEASDKALAAFDKSITLTVDLNGLIDRAKLQPFEHLAIFYQTDNPDAPWSELLDAREVSPEIVQVPLAHFSTYAAAVSGNVPASWHLKYIPPTVGLFSGAMTFAYPIEVPAGRHGLQPAISLSYSSRAVDGVMSINGEDSDGVPFGWSLDMASIARNGMKYQPDGAHKHIYFPERFSLAINGGNYDLFPARDGAHCGRYYAKDAPQLHITRYNDSSDCIGTPGTITNSTHEYWIVKTGDGTTYRFGYNSDSEQVVTQTGGFARAEGYAGALCANGASNCDGGASRWRVDQVTDVYNNVMTFSYHETSSAETPEEGGNEITTQHTRVKLIDYNGSLSRVEFTNSNDPDYNWVNRIRVYNNGNTNKIREYQLQWDGYSQRLLSITPYDSGSLALPATTFTHIDLNHANNLPFPYVQRIDNGYGGATEFSYLADNRKEGGYGYSYVVTESRTNDGLRTNPVRVQYAYGTRCYDQWDNPALLHCTGVNPDQYGPLVGHDVVTETVLNDDGTPASISLHYFYHDDALADKPLRGRESRTQTRDSNGNPLTQADSTYMTMTIGGGAIFAYLSQSDQTTYASGTSLTKRTTYAYDSYGHVSQQREYAKAGDATPYRTTTTDYVVNEALWIVDTMILVRTYAGDATPAAEIKRVGYYYDRDASGAVRGWGAAPLRGEMVLEDAYGGKYQGGAFQPDVHIWTYNWYYGNGNLSDTADAKGNTTHTDYDTTYNIYPVQVLNAKSQPTIMAYNLALGLVTQVTDLNNAVTQYQYDTFGRLLKVAKPYDTLSIPTIEYVYVDGYNVNGLKGVKVQENYREVSGNANAFRPIIKLYDGLGRLVQERAETIDGSQQSVSNVTYDARGLTRYTYAPDFESFSWDFVRPTGWDSRAKTINDYDTLSRVKTVTAPDGTQTNTAYGIAVNEADPDFNNGGRITTWVTDANNHTKRTSYDRLGRLQTVSEFSGSTEYRTRYSYDTLDNLLQVTDAVGNVTNMTYNSFGQKLSMADPDMGYWTYQYDAVGNLTQQIDAKGQVLGFNYDQLNRLTDKRQGGQGGTVLASYVYDLGANGVGHRTSMSDVSSGSSTTWTYDPRGRVTQENKTIDGTPYPTGYAYDAMDRVTSITYPTGEVVNQTYNFGPQLSSVAGTNNYASGMTYNPLGQLKQMNLGNGLQSRYNYFGLDTTGTQFYGRLRQICVITPTDLCPNDAPSTAKLNLSYWYDNVGNVSDIRDRTNENQVVHFGYDSLDRLINASTNLLGTGQYNQAFEYDAIGNLTRKGNNGYTYNPSGANSVRPHAATAAGGNSYAYDGNGNMTTRIEDSVTYAQAWNVENRPTAITNTTTGQVTQYTYDGDGNRVKKVDASGATVYGGNNFEASLSYDAFSGFSGGINPGPAGTWRYGYSASLGNALNLYTSQSSANSLATWRTPSSDEPSVSKNATGQDIYIDSGNILVPAADFLHLHPGPNGEYSVVRWTAPAAGTYRIAATFKSLRVGNVGATTDVHVLRNSTAIFNAQVTGFVGSGTRDFGTVLTLVAGDTIDFAVGWGNGTYYWDSTGLKAIITPLGTTKSYYFAGSQRIAMRVQGDPVAGNNGVFYFAADHLGSTSVTLDAYGTKIGEMKYMPFGETRYTWGGTPTDRRFTGQREENGLGSLYDYGARMYSSVLGRFLSADTIVPSPSDPQQLNRYAYARGNPVKYIDPSGHAVTCGTTADGCEEPYAGHPLQQPYPSDALDNAWNFATGAGVAVVAAVAAPEIAGAAVGARYVTGALGAFTNMAGSAGAQIATGKIDLGDTLIAGVAGFFTGYVMPTNPLQSALTYGTAGAAQYIATEAVHGRTPSPGLTLLNTGLSAGLGVKFGTFSEPPSSSLLQASIPQIWNAEHGVASAAAEISFKNASNIWAYVPQTYAPLSIVRSVFSALSSNLPGLMISPNQ